MDGQTHNYLLIIMIVEYKDRPAPMDSFKSQVHFARARHCNHSRMRIVGIGQRWRLPVLAQIVTSWHDSLAMNLVLQDLSREDA